MDKLVARKIIFKSFNNIVQLCNNDEDLANEVACTLYESGSVPTYDNVSSIRDEILKEKAKISKEEEYEKTYNEILEKIDTIPGNWIITVIDTIVHRNKSLNKAHMLRIANSIYEKYHIEETSDSDDINTSSFYDIFGDLFRDLRK